MKFGLITHTLDVELLELEEVKAQVEDLIIEVFQKARESNREVKFFNFTVIPGHDALLLSAVLL